MLLKDNKNDSKNKTIKKEIIEEYREKYNRYLLNKKSDMEVIKTCSRKLNKSLGGGLPKGKIIEISGHEGSGKSSLLLSIAAHLLEQNKEGFIVIVDAEAGINSHTILEKIGLDLQRSLIINISDGEKVFNIIEDMVKEKKCLLVVIDSVASLLTEEDLTLGCSSLGAHSRMISKRLKRLIGIMNENNSSTTIVMINQIRNKINDLWKGETNYTTTGGKALKYYSSLRLEISRGEFVKEKEERKGFYADIKVLKSRISIPYLKFPVVFLYGTGFSNEIEIIDILIENLIIEKQNNGYYSVNINDEKISFRSKWNLIDKCLKEKDFFNKLQELVTKIEKDNIQKNTN